jgi:hypothetical protein
MRAYPGRSAAVTVRHQERGTWFEGIEDVGLHWAAARPGGTAISRTGFCEEKRMGAEELKTALEGAREIEITVTGRRSGRQITIPVWFVQEGGAIYLLPVRGPDSDWYKNLVKNLTIRLAVDGAEYSTRVTPITEPARVSDIVNKFRAKYGSRDVAAYYSRPEVAVEVPLT